MEGIRRRLRRILDEVLPRADDETPVEAQAEDTLLEDLAKEWQFDPAKVSIDPLPEQP